MSREIAARKEGWVRTCLHALELMFLHTHCDLFGDFFNSDVVVLIYIIIPANTQLFISNQSETLQLLDLDL